VRGGGGAHFVRFGGIMNQDGIKHILLALEDTTLDFSVIFTGKKSKKVNGLYKYDSFEILLHNKNFSSDSELIYTAIHEYAHHLEYEKLLAQNGGEPPLKLPRFHNTDFWTHFHSLLEIAEKKGYYILKGGMPNSLSALTEEIQKLVLQNGQTVRDLGGLLMKAQKACEKENVRYEDYIDRVLQMPRTAAKTIAKIAEFQVAPALGYENMKFVAALPSGEQRKTAEAQFLSGKTPDTVRGIIKPQPKQTDTKTRLEQEKKRIERTIQTLSARLKQVEENLAKL
jgi:hypothetical protein